MNLLRIIYAYFITLQIRFDEWWSTYPKKINKAGCKEKWRSRKLDDLADIIISDTKTRTIYDTRWKEGYIPNSTTYLNQSRWESEIETNYRNNDNIKQDPLGLDDTSWIEQVGYQK